MFISLLEKISLYMCNDYCIIIVHMHHACKLSSVVTLLQFK